jgi:hypothetical protein
MGQRRSCSDELPTCRTRRPAKSGAMPPTSTPSPSSSRTWTALLFYRDHLGLPLQRGFRCRILGNLAWRASCGSRTRRCWSDGTPASPLHVPDLLNFCRLHERGVRFVAEPTRQGFGIMAGGPTGMCSRCGRGGAERGRERRKRMKAERLTEPAGQCGLSPSVRRVRRREAAGVDPSSAVSSVRGRPLRDVRQRLISGPDDYSRSLTAHHHLQPRPRRVHRRGRECPCAGNTYVATPLGQTLQSRATPPRLCHLCRRAGHATVTIRGCPPATRRRSRCPTRRYSTNVNATRR